ncbi:hypothetical protein Ciccas_000906, partial [Cichlidogyrus casuarinus]
MHKSKDYFNVSVEFLEELKLWFRAYALTTGFSYSYKTSLDQVYGQTHYFHCDKCGDAAVCDYFEAQRTIRVKIRNKHVETAEFPKNANLLRNALQSEFFKLNHDFLAQEYRHKREKFFERKRKKHHGFLEEEQPKKKSLVEEVSVGNRMIKVARLATVDMDIDDEFEEMYEDSAEEDEMVEVEVKPQQSMEEKADSDAISSDDEEEEAHPDQEAVSDQGYKSDLEMICHRTNSDYFVIDPNKLHIFTTHMMRQAAAHPCTQMMVFMGTTKTELVYGFILTVISTRLPSGVYPILMALHTEDSVDQYISILQSMMEKYPTYFGGSRAPNYVMMDGNFPGFGAVEAVLNESKIFICPRLTMTTLKSIAAVIPDSKFRALFNELTFK